jgi:hypothetical protein
MERLARQHAVAVESCLIEHGCSHRQAAEYLRLSPRTLRDWQHAADENSLAFHPLGRPLHAATTEQRNEVIHTLDEQGPGIGLPTLRDIFPDLARAALADVLHRYRALWRRLNRQTLHVLHWTRPGSVWAIDFHGPRPPVDGTDPDLLAVRDLASGWQLLWLPVRDATADTVVRQLTGLFMIHGAPLVLKCDNGSFGAAAVQELLRQWRVRSLFSPPRRPSYNGAIEAGIGSLTSRTEQHASRRGYPGHRTRDDVEAARLEANTCARPRGPLGPSPDDLWTGRTLLCERERRGFLDRLADMQEDKATAQGQALDCNRTEWQRRATDRQLVSRALVELGYLHYTRRRISPPIPRRKAA